MGYGIKFKPLSVFAFPSSAYPLPTVVLLTLENQRST